MPMVSAFRPAALAALLLLASPPPPVAAETPRAGLARVKSVKATVSQTTPSAPDCGVDTRALLPRLERGLAEGGLTPSGSSPVTVTMSLMTAYDANRGVCATSVLLGAYRGVSFFDEEAGWLTAGDVVLWQRATEILSDRATHDKAAERAVDRLASALIASWKIENAASQAAR
jgi:hypothetical protein